MKATKYYRAGELILLFLISLVPSTAFAGGSSFSIEELHPHARELMASKTGQLLEEFRVSLYNPEIQGMKDMTFEMSCGPDDVFENVTIGTGTKTLGSTQFTLSDNQSHAFISAKNYTITPDTPHDFWIKIDLKESTKTRANVCRTFSFNFVDTETGERYGSERSVEGFAEYITPITILSSSEAPLKDIFSVSIKNIGSLTYQMGAKNQLIYSGGIHTKQDIVIDDLIFSCQDSASLTQLTLKDQSTETIKQQVAPSTTDPPSENFNGPIQSAFFKDIDWEIPEGSTEINVLGSFGTNSLAHGFNKGCSIVAINAHTKDNKSIHPTLINGIGLNYQTSPLNLFTGFIDIKKDDALYDAVMYLHNNNIVRGYENGAFLPLNKINRAEFITMIAIAGYERLENTPSDCSKLKNYFKDVNQYNWYGWRVCQVFNKGWIQGYPDGTFRPEKNVSRAEAIKLALVSDGFTVASSQGDRWYEPYIKPAQERNLLFNDANLERPNEEITRGEMATILYNAIIWSASKPSKVLMTMVDQLKTQTGERYIGSSADKGLLAGDFQLQCSQQTFDLYEKILKQISTERLELKYENLFDTQLNFFAPIFIFKFQPFHIAVNSNCLEIAKEYLKEGALINDTEGYSGKAPLHIAVDNQDETMVDILITAGADPNVKTSPFQSDVLNFSAGDIWGNVSPLYFAIVHNNLDLTKKLLEAGADPNILQKKVTALDLAKSLSSSSEMLDLLKQYGAKTTSESF